jgi:hypothetical protein
MSLQKLPLEINFPVPIETIDLDDARNVLLQKEVNSFEIELLLKILYSVPMMEFNRYKELTRKRDESGKLTELELYEISALLSQLNRYAIERNRAIIDLAHFRKIPPQQLMEELKVEEEEKAERARRRAAALKRREVLVIEGS